MVAVLSGPDAIRDSTFINIALHLALRILCLVNEKQCGRKSVLNEHEELVGELLLRGLSVRMIASELSVSKSSVHRFIKHLNLEKNIGRDNDRDVS